MIAYINFNEHKLFSNTITLDSTYKEIMGMSYDQYKAKMNEEREKFLTQRQCAKEKIPYISTPEENIVEISNTSEIRKAILTILNDFNYLTDSYISNYNEEER